MYQDDIEAIGAWCAEHPQYEQRHGFKFDAVRALQCMTATKLIRVERGKAGTWPCEHPPWVWWQCPTCGCKTWNCYPTICTRCAYGHLRTYVPASQFDDDWQPEDAPRNVTERVCLSCGISIEHLRPQAKTCSPKCRKAYQRKQAEIS